MRLAMVMFFLLFCSTAGCTTYRPMNRIDGIAAISASAEGVRVEPNPAFSIWKPAQSTPRQTSIVMKPGDRISIGDGHHVTINLQFVGLHDDRYRFVVESIGRPPNCAIVRNVANIAVLAYGG